MGWYPYPIHLKTFRLAGQYKVEELCVSRYAPGWVKGNGENVTLREDYGRGRRRCFQQICRGESEGKAGRDGSRVFQR